SAGTSIKGLARITRGSSAPSSAIIAGSAKERPLRSAQPRNASPSQARLSSDSSRVRKPRARKAAATLARSPPTIAAVRRATPARKAGGKSLARPKSSSTSRPPGWTRMLPGCGSAWKKPCTRICSQKRSISRRATSAGSTPSARRPSTSVTRTPGADADRHREAPQVDPHDALDVRVLHLGRHRAPVAQPAPMHLRQRGRGERRRIELGERRLDRPPELAAQERQEGREPPRRHAILQLREHLDVLRGQDVGARAHELADLDG